MTAYDFLEHFSCPDCGSDVMKHESDLLCIECNRCFKVYNGICVDFIPKNKTVRKCETDLEERAFKVYGKLFDETFAWKENPKPWGLEVPQYYLKKLKKHKYQIGKLIPHKITKCVDVSTGSGRFSWDLAEKADMCVFCDISVDSVVYLTKRALAEKKSNVIIVRADYASPPFKTEVFDLCLCQDTLIYGYSHETNLLQTLHKITLKNGCAIIDFSNKYHHGFWHKPYTYRYSRKQMNNILQNSGFQIEECLPLYYELSNDLDEVNITSKIAKLVLPPTRYIYKIVK